MNITVVGGGNLGTLLCAKLSMNRQNNVTLLTEKTEKFSDKLEVIDEENQKKFFSYTISITENYKRALMDADIVFCTLPSFLRENFVNQAKDYLKKTCLLGFVPGYGGIEFICSDLIKQGICLFGFSRVPYICRLKAYGKSVICKSEKKEIFLGTIPANRAPEVAELIQMLFNIKTYSLSSYLSVTLTPSNPILHTSRIYDLFGFYAKDMIYNYHSYFYEDWTDKASDILMKCDEELQNIVKVLFRQMNISTSEVLPLFQHYGVSNSKELTNKIKTIDSFKQILSPMIPFKQGYIPDLTSRYFIEDFSFGLVVIKGIGLIAEVETQGIDKVLDWYSSLSGEKYFDGNKPGLDLMKCGAPQKYKITSLEQLHTIYS